MRFNKTELTDAYIIETDIYSDERGSFFRSFCKDEFKKANIEFSIVQTSISRNIKAGTLRGMHFQKQPQEEVKIVRCINGEVYDVIIDLRRDSNTYKQWLGVCLSAINSKALYIPAGFAHGFLTLTDNAEIEYLMNEYYNPELASGVRWNDLAFQIEWPQEINVISEKDLNYSNYQ